MGRKTKEINALKKTQSMNLDIHPDDYMVGLYNGLELASAVLENREPEFKDCITKEPEVIEKEEKAGRTRYSGVIRRESNC